MSSLAKLPDVVGFFSYSRDDDKDSKARLSKLRDAIQRELGSQLGADKKHFRLWQDKEAIPLGTLWESKIKEAIDKSLFFISIVTPRAVGSRHCKFEFQSFTERERALDRDDLIFPILYIAIPALDDEEEWRSDPVLSIIGRRQYVDWQDYRFMDVDTPAFSQEIARFCDKIVKALRKPWVSPEERRKQEETAALRRAEEERIRQEAEAKKRAEEEARRREEEAEAQRRDDEERIQREGQAKKRADEEARRAEDAKRRQTEEAEAEAARQVEEERRVREAAEAARQAEERAREAAGATRDAREKREAAEAAERAEQARRLAEAEGAGKAVEAARGPNSKGRFAPESRGWKARAAEACESFKQALDSCRESGWLEAGPSGGGTAYPQMNVFRKGDDFIIITEIPGVKKSDLEVQVNERMLRFFGEKSIGFPEKASVHRRERLSGRFDRLVTMPVEIDPDGVKTNYRDGILALFLPRAKNEKAKTIKV